MDDEIRNCTRIRRFLVLEMIVKIELGDSGAEQRESLEKKRVNRDDQDCIESLKEKPCGCLVRVENCVRYLYIVQEIKITKLRFQSHDKIH